MTITGKPATEKFTYNLKLASGYFNITVKDGLNEKVYEDDNVYIFRPGDASLIYCVFSEGPFDPSGTYPALWISTGSALEQGNYPISPTPGEHEFLSLCATYRNGQVGGSHPGTGTLSIKALSNQPELLHIEGNGHFDYPLDDREINVVINSFTAQYHPAIFRF
ncbi:hypothetical protein [Pseudomonas sp. 2835]|uniref:hypothetical protein n=1 Tax=Pseudomonas sp. 2835 TaxID=3156451 RepID=UPI003D1F551C